MNESRQHPLIRTPFLVALLAAVMIGGSVIGYRIVTNLPVFAGEHHARLGEVWLDIDEETGAMRGSAEHVYRLTNRTRRTIVVQDVRSSCGCTVPKIDVDTIEPGEEFEVVAAVHLDRPGRRSAEVFLHIEGGDVQTLTLEAVGRSRLPLRAQPHRVALVPQREVTVRVIAELWENNDREPHLSVRSPAGVEASLANWRLWRPANPQRRTPTLWSGAVRVSMSDVDALSDDAAIEISLDDEHVLRVPVRVHSFDDA